jgi:hypothetical protein
MKLKFLETTVTNQIKLIKMSKHINIGEFLLPCGSEYYTFIRHIWELKKVKYTSVGIRLILFYTHVKPRLSVTNGLHVMCNLWL